MGVDFPHAHIFIPQIVFVVVVQESKLLNRHAGSVTRALILKRDGGDPAIANKYTSKKRAVAWAEELSSLMPSN